MLNLWGIPAHCISTVAGVSAPTGSHPSLMLHHFNPRTSHDGGAAIRDSLHLDLDCQVVPLSGILVPSALVSSLQPELPFPLPLKDLLKLLTYVKPVVLRKCLVERLLNTKAADFY